MIKKLIMISLFVFGFFVTCIEPKEVTTVNQKVSAVGDQDEVFVTEEDRDNDEGIYLVSLEVLEEAKEQM